MSVISDATNTITTTITDPSFNQPSGVAFDPHNNEVYVTNQGSGTVSVIPDSTNTVTTTITVGSGPFAVAFDPHNNEVYVTNANSDTVSVFSG